MYDFLLYLMYTSVCRHTDALGSTSSDGRLHRRSVSSRATDAYAPRSRADAADERTSPYSAEFCFWGHHNVILRSGCTNDRVYGYTQLATS